MRILFVGDIVGTPGRRCLAQAVPALRSQHVPDVVIANGENSAGGNGITPGTAKEIFGSGVDVITSGNHAWDRPEILSHIDDQPRLLRPANYPDPTPGSGLCLVPLPDGATLAVVNLLGRVFMGDYDDPFRAADRILAEIDGRATAIFVDFHAEATSEKMALGWHLDGRVSAVIGTHTHVPTADERVLPGGTAFISDAGMTGPYDSVIGVDKTQVLARFLSQRPVRYRPAENDLRLAGVLVDIAPDGRADSIRRIEYRMDESA
jgi:metallophosphoesterase (TIGR00282 family)